MFLKHRRVWAAMSPLPTIASFSSPATRPVTWTTMPSGWTTDMLKPRPFGPQQPVGLKRPAMSCAIAGECGHSCATMLSSHMTALPKHRMTADEFLAWAEAQPNESGRFELWDGQIVIKRGPAEQQQSERARHWDAKFAIASALKAAVKNSKLPCFAVPEGAGLRLTNDRVVEPDAMVYCGQRVQPDALYVPNPIIVVEVLSPTTASFDHGLKLGAYFKLVSVHHYLIIDPTARLIIHHSRGSGDALMTRIVAELQLKLDPPGLDVDLSELFEAG